MTAIQFKGFRGAVPRLGERLQLPKYASTATNVKITSGKIEPLRGMLPSVTTLAESIKTIWRYRRVSNRVNSDHWLTFADDTDVVGSLIASDEEGRMYWTSEAHEPRMSNYANAINATGPYPVAFFRLGVPSPAVAPTVVATGGTGPTVTRSYAFTRVNGLNEESGPSPASDLATGNADGTWTVSGMGTTAPANGAALAGWTSLPGGTKVRLSLTNAESVEVGVVIEITGATQATDSMLGQEINQAHRIIAVDKTANTADVLLREQNTGTGGDWVFQAPMNTASMKKRVYRTEGTAAAFLFVAEIPIGDDSYADASVTGINEVLPTLNTLPPPGNLTCLTSLPNGCLAGLNGNELCFSDPYLPYSWPVGNRYSFVGRGVALFPTGNSVIVLTDGYPILFTGSDPEAMSPTILETYAPCVSKRGAVSIGGGALYPSFDGLWLASTSGVQLRTQSLYRLDEWKALRPETLEAVFFDGRYMAVHSPENFNTKRMLVLDIAELDSAVAVSDFADALCRNDYDGTLYAVKGSKILKWDSNDFQRYFSEWTSVEVQLDRPTNFSHAQIHAAWDQSVPLDESDLTANRALIAAGPEAVNGYINGFEFNTIDVGRSRIKTYNPGTERKVQFILFNGKKAVFARRVDSERPFRLPSGFKQESLRAGLQTSITIYSMTIAESTSELTQASA